MGELKKKGFTVLAEDKEKQSDVKCKAKDPEHLKLDEKAVESLKEFAVSVTGADCKESKTCGLKKKIDEYVKALSGDKGLTKAQAEERQKVKKDKDGRVATTVFLSGNDKGPIAVMCFEKYSFHTKKTHTRVSMRAFQMTKD